MNQEQIAFKKHRAKCLQIVESMLTEGVIGKEELLSCCEQINRSDYDDIVTERSLMSVCGYALCQHKLNQNKFKPQQKFAISFKLRQVLDINERRKFCNEECLVASNHLRQQIDEQQDLLWLASVKDVGQKEKEKERKRFHLYGQNELKDEEKNENASVEDGKEEKSVKGTPMSSSNIAFPYIDKDSLEQLKETMKGLTIKERYD